MKGERVGFNLLFDGSNIQVFGNGHASFSQIEKIINWLYRAGTERLTCRKFCRLDLCGELGKLRLSVPSEAIKNIGKKYWDKLRQSLRVRRFHVFDSGIIRPERIEGFDQSSAQVVT